MQITGEKQKINCVTLTHNGNSLKYRNIIVRKEMLPIEAERLNDAEIVFADLNEVDMLIGMLENFKSCCKREFGEWCRKSGDV